MRDIRAKVRVRANDERKNGISFKSSKMLLLHLTSKRMSNHLLTFSNMDTHTHYYDYDYD